MMKRITSLMAAAVVAAVGLCPAAWAQEEAPGEDYTSYLVNPSFTEGASNLPGDTISSTAGRGYIMAPKGWKMTYQTTTWDRQFLSYSDYTEIASSCDEFQTPLLEPQDNDDGFYFHAITGGGTAAPGTIYSVLQEVNTLPSGRYVLTFYGVLKDRNNTKLGVELSVPKVVAETSAGVAETEVDTCYYEDVPTWMPGEVSFVVAEDNDPVTFGLRFELKGMEEQQLYLDNFHLYRTGDVSVEDLINSVLGEASSYQMTLYNSFVSYPYECVPAGWEETIYGYTDSQGDGITTLDSANAFLAEIQMWIARVDSLISNHAELQTLSDSIAGLVELGEHQTGLAALTELQTTVNTALVSPLLPTELIDLIDKTEIGIRDYFISDALLNGSYEEPADITSIIINPGVDAPTGIQDPYVANGWYIEATGTSQQYIFQDQTLYQDSATGTYFNTWDSGLGNAKYTATQTLRGLPAGLYLVRALMASDGPGTYLFGRTGESTYTSTEGPSAGTYFEPVEVSVLLPQDGDLTIGVTSNADALWGGDAFGGYYYAADDFELYYCGADTEELYDMLNTRIAELESYISADSVANNSLKGDMAPVRTSITELKQTPEELSAISAGLTQVTNLFATVDASVEAFVSVTDKVGEIELKIDTLAEKVTDETKAAINSQIELTNVWLLDDYSVTDEAAVMIADLDSLSALADADALAWDKQHLEVGDATFVLVNPDIANGTEGYHMEAYNGAYIVAAADFFPDLHTHLCFWSGEVPADSVGFDMYQNVSGIPSGYYRMTAMAVVGANDPNIIQAFSNGNVVFYAIGDVNHEVQVPLRHAPYEAGDTLTYSADGTLDSVVYYSNEPYMYTLDSILVNHGEFRFGMKTIGPMNVNTARIYGFTLEYLEPVEYEPYPDAIEEVGADAAELKAYAKNGYIIVETDEPYEIYSVSGGAALSPDTQLVPGVYIVKAGAKTVKVLVD